MRIDIRVAHADRRHVVEIDLLEFLGDSTDPDTLFGRRGVYLVVDVGDVAGVDDIGPLVTQQPNQHVEYDRGAGIADMCVGIDGRPAHIYRHPVGIDGNEFFFGARQRIIKMQFHGAENISAGDRL